MLFVYSFSFFLDIVQSPFVLQIQSRILFPLTNDMDQNDIQITEESRKTILVSLKDDNLDVVSSLIILMSTEPVPCSVFDELATFLKGLTLEDRTYFWTMVIQMQHFGFDPCMVAPFVTNAIAKFGITWKVVFKMLPIVLFMNRDTTNVLYEPYRLVESLKDKLEIRLLAAAEQHYLKKKDEAQRIRRIRPKGDISV